MSSTEHIVSGGIMYDFLFYLGFTARQDYFAYFEPSQS